MRASYRPFGRVEVFGFFVAQHAPAKAYALAFGVADGKHDAVAKAVVAFFACVFRVRVGRGVFWRMANHQAAFFQQGVGIVAKYAAQMPPAGRRIAQAKARSHFAREAALLQVVDGGGAALELFFVVGSGFFEHIGQRRLLVPLRGFAGAVLWAEAIIGHLHAVLLRQLLHRIHKPQAVEFHQKIYRIAIFAATKAVVELLGGADRKRGRLFAVKRAQTRQIGPRLFQLHMAANHVHHVNAVEQVLNKSVGDGHGGIVGGGLRVI